MAVSQELTKIIKMTANGDAVAKGFWIQAITFVAGAGASTCTISDTAGAMTIDVKVPTSTMYTIYFGPPVYFDGIKISALTTMASVSWVTV